MGRPKAPIDAEQVEKLARLGCTQEEIADFFGVTAQTISARFREEYTRARASLKMSLRRAQVHRAIRDRSDSMLIHLGKVHLGQSEKIEADIRQSGQVGVSFERIDSPRDQEIPPPAEAKGVRE